MVDPITDASFNQIVLTSDKLTLVHFWAEWSKPCKMMSSLLNDLSVEYQGRVAIVKMNVDDNSVIPANFNIRSLPALIIFKDGKEVARSVGVKNRNVKDFIDANI